jgi:hypothetical protein
MATRRKSLQHRHLIGAVVAGVVVGVATVTASPVAPAAADPYASCAADVCIVSISEAAPAPVSSGAGATAISSLSGPSFVGSSVWLANVVSAFQGGTAYVTTSDASATAYQVVSAPDDIWLIIGQQVAVKPDGSKVYAGVYKPGNWANHDSADVLITTAPGGTSATGSALHWDVLGEGTTTYGVTLSPDRKSVKLRSYANGYVLPNYLLGGVDVESTPAGTTVQTTPKVLP